MGKLQPGSVALQSSLTRGQTCTTLLSSSRSALWSICKYCKLLLLVCKLLLVVHKCPLQTPHAAQTCPEPLAQTVRAEVYQSISHLVRQPARSLIKPELVWQIERGLQLTKEEVTVQLGMTCISCYVQA